eukprot:1112733-Alexandrium_andersonii.AAC.1
MAVAINAPWSQSLTRWATQMGQCALLAGHEADEATAAARRNKAPSLYHAWVSRMLCCRGLRMHRQHLSHRMLTLQCSPPRPR